MNIKLNVKDKSIETFFEKRIVYPTNQLKPHDSSLNNLNPCNYFKDEIFIKKDKDLKKGDVIKFEAADRSMKSNKALVNIYTYHVEKYDDICDRLRLTDFNIDFQEDENNG